MHRVHDGGEERDDVAVGEGEHRVQVHRRAQLRHAGDDHVFRGLLLEQGGGHLADRLTRRPLAHAHQHHPVADGHDVAALEGRLAPVLLGVAPPDGGADEVRVELVDRLVEQGLVVPGRPEERVQGQPAVQPAGGVPRVQRVRQRRHEVLPRPRRLAGECQVVADRKSSGRSEVASPPMRNSASWRGSSESRNARVSSSRPRPTWLATILRSSSQALASGRPRSRRAVVQLDHVDAAAPQLVDEVGVVALRVLDPQDVVEQEVVGVRGGQPPVRQTRCADQDLAQLPDLRVDAVRRGHALGHGAAFRVDFTG